MSRNKDHMKICFLLFQSSVVILSEVQEIYEGDLDRNELQILLIGKEESALIRVLEKNHANKTKNPNTWVGTTRKGKSF